MIGALASVVAVALVSSVALAQEPTASEADGSATAESAQDNSEPRSPYYLIEEKRRKPKPHIWHRIGLGASGVAAAFFLHEMGHVLMNLAYRNYPTLQPVTYGGFIPFFTIDPGITCGNNGCVDANGDRFKGGRTGKYFITSAGFLVQSLITEAIMSKDPMIRYHYKPFQKGMLLFNTTLSFGYALSAWLGLEPRSGDIRGMADASGINHNLMALLVALPAGIDLYRYLKPDAKWAPWFSRASKATLIGVAFIH